MSPTINLELPPDEPFDCDGVSNDDFERSMLLFERARKLTLEELEICAFEVGCRWDDLRGETASGKAAQLSAWCARVGRLNGLRVAVDKAFGVSG